MKTTISIIFLMSATSICSALTINIQFGTDTYDGHGVLDQGNTWNVFGIGGATSAPLVDSTGNNLSALLSFSSSSGFGGSTELVDLPVGLLGNGLYGPFSFSISGLDPLDIFSVYTFNHDKAGHSTTTEIEGNQITSQTPTDTINKESFVTGGNYLVFESINPDEFGVISGSSSIAWGGLNGIQITTVPELNTYPVIMGMFVIVVALSRRNLC